MDFSKSLMYIQPYNTTRVLNINARYEFEVPGHAGYFYDFADNCVYSTKVGEKFLPKRKKLKIYTTPKDDKKRPDEEFVMILTTKTNCRERCFLSDIRSEIYKEVMSPMVRLGPNPITIPGIIYDRKYD